MYKLVLLMTIWSSILTLVGCNSKKDKSNAQPSDGEIEMVDPNKILMTISTIENSLPETNDNALDELNLEIHEDDWRQLEFIKKDQTNLIEQELASIQLIIQNESVDVGDHMQAFKNLHVRKLIPKPLKDGIDIRVLEQSFSSVKSGSLSFNQYGRVNNGINFDVSGFQLYGIVKENKVTAFAFYGLSSWDELPTFISEIKKLMSTENLVLVDWRLMKIIDASGIDDYLKPSGK